jgi:hypothetical protein
LKKKMRKISSSEGSKELEEEESSEKCGKE